MTHMTKKYDISWFGRSWFLKKHLDLSIPTCRKEKIEKRVGNFFHYNFWKFVVFSAQKYRSRGSTSHHISEMIGDFLKSSDTKWAKGNDSMPESYENIPYSNWIKYLFVIAHWAVKSWIIAKPLEFSYP